MTTCVVMIAINWLTSTHKRRRLDEENITIKYKVERIVWYLIISLFTVNPIKLYVFPLPTLLHTSVSGSPSNLIGIIYCIFTSLGNHMQRSLVFFKD